jgi:hypothetical protein
MPKKKLAKGLDSGKTCRGARERQAKKKEGGFLPSLVYNLILFNIR